MSGALAFESSWLFVLKCLRLYWGSCPFLIYFCIGLIWTLVFQKGKSARVFWYYTIMLGLTIYNPLLVHFLVPRFMDAQIYYRMLWILPVAIGVAYYFTLIVAKCSKSWMKWGTAAALLAVIMFTSSVNGNIVYNIRLPENIYKVPDAILYACEMIHQDYTGEEEPRAIFTDEYEIYVRQYDPSIRLTIDRDTRLYYNGETMVGAIEEDAKYKRRARILDVINSKGGVSVNKFRQAMQKTKTNYLVIPQSYSCHEYLEKAGCVPFAWGENMVVYRFELEEEDT